MIPEIPHSELKGIYARIRTRRRFFNPPSPPQPGGWRELVRRNHFGLRAALIALGAIAVLTVPVLYFLDVSSVNPVSSPGGGVAGNEAALKLRGLWTAIRDDPGNTSTSMSPNSPTKIPQDPIENLLERIQGRHFSSPAEVATGQFLRGFPLLVHEIDEIDLSKLRPRQRGVGWTVVRAHSRTDHEPWEKPRPGRPMQLRCARDGENWKVKQLIMLGKDP